jgi:Cellulose binding domain
VNRGGRDVPLRELTIRYWYTVDRWRPQQVWCDWAPFGNANVMGRTVRLARPASGADSYLELRFAEGAGHVVAGRSSGEIKTRFNKDDWSPFDQRDDWSWTSATGRYAAAPKITLYRNGRLVWGRQPPAA